MRRLWILILFISNISIISSVFADEACHTSLGVDHKLPAAVMEELKKKKMEEFQLVNKTVCATYVTWHALPPSFPPSQPWPPGVMKLVSWNTKRNKAEIL